jgi:hypothetical protein
VLRRTRNQLSNDSIGILPPYADGKIIQKAARFRLIGSGGQSKTDYCDEHCSVLTFPMVM